MKQKLPKPECHFGYTDTQLDEILGDQRSEFNKWMSGQTIGDCDGRIYSYERHKYEPSKCHPAKHGWVIYPWDLERFLAGQPVVD